MEGDQFVIVPKAIQKEAVTFLNTQLFATPKWLMDQKIFSKINPDNGVEAIKEMQKSTLNSVLAGDRMVRLMEASSQGKEFYSVDDLMTDLRNGIFSELKTNAPIDIYRRNMQKLYVGKLIDLLTPGNTSVRSIPVGASSRPRTRQLDLDETDLPSITRGQLISLKSALKASALKTTDKLSKLHLQDLAFRIEKALDPK